MYADQVEAQSNRSVKDRLHGNLASDSGRRVPVSGKRNREGDDRWEHDLFEDGASRVSNSRVDARDLRSKLQRKTTGQGTQSSRGSISGGVRDLREKLSGILSSNDVESNTPPRRPKPTPKVSRPTRKSVIAQAPKPKKAESVENFLQSLGLDKYSITFQAEEVDMTALIHMSDEDLKALGIPMGPRKKILLALESKPDV